MPEIITMVREKDCKHSVRFKSTHDDPNNPAPVDTVYVNRTHPGINQAKTIELTVTVTE